MDGGQRAVSTILTIDIVQRCFGDIAMVPGSADLVAERWNNDIDPRILNAWKFSDAFEVFFPENGYQDDDHIISWLKVIAERFNLTNVPKSRTWIKIKNSVGYLFESLGMEDLVTENHSLFQFWTYLFILHRGTLKKKYRRPWLPLDFLKTMTCFPIEHIKVVFVGFEIRQNNTIASRLLPFLNAANRRCVLNQRVVTQFNFELDRWTDQGVLFINPQLAIDPEIILSYARFLIHYINNTMENVVFVVAGDCAARILHLIDQSIHNVMEVHHPWFIHHTPHEPHKDWMQIMSFINSNFYRYQFIGNECEIVDWCGMHDLDVERRVHKLRPLFRKALEKHQHTKTSGVLYFYRPRQNIKIFRNPSKLILQYRHWSQYSG